MSESTVELTKAETLVEEMKSPGKFDLSKAINQVSYPTGKVSVFLDGAQAGRSHEIAGELLDLKHLAATQSAGSNGGIVDDPEMDDTLAQIAVLEAEQAEVIDSILSSKLTFHMRGVAPAVWRSVDKNARASADFKPKDKTNTEEVQELSMQRNDWVNAKIIAHSIVSIENADGDVDDSAVSIETVNALHDALLQVEWDKIKDKMEELTFAANLFAQATEQDADFLPQR